MTDPFIHLTVILLSRIPGPNTPGLGWHSQGVNEKIDRDSVHLLLLSSAALSFSKRRSFAQTIYKTNRRFCYPVSLSSCILQRHSW